ncbi:MAG: M1 family metallopeptidase [Candidatus Polarisedimenticolia bacterium]
MRVGRVLFLALSTLLAFVPSGALRASAPATQEDLNRIADAFYGSSAIDETAARAVQNVTLKKDFATLVLESGTLYPSRPVEGVVASAVFLGKGSLSVAPVRALDKSSLNIAAAEHFRKTLDGKLSASFSEMLIVSMDSTLADLLKGLPEAQPQDASRASQVLRDRLKQIQGREGDQRDNFNPFDNFNQMPLDMALVEKVAGTVADGPFLAQMNTGDFGWIQYIHDGRRTFEVRLSGFESVGAFSEERPLLVTHRVADLDPAGRYLADPQKDQKDQIDIQKFSMEITIPNTQHFTVDGTVELIPLLDGLRTLRFDLVNFVNSRTDDQTAKPIRVVKVTDSDGKALPYLHRRNLLMVLMPAPPAKSEILKLGFSLDEETIQQYSSVHYRLLNIYPWFPRHGYLGGRYSMDWTIKAKKPLYATGSGRLVREDLTTDRTYNITQLAFETAVQAPSLIFGQYQKVKDVYESTGKPSVEIAVYSWPRTEFNVLNPDTRDTGEELEDGEDLPPRTVEVTVPGGKPKDVVAETKDILKLAEGLYGPYPYNSLNVVQMSPFMPFSQAPPGLVQLTGEAFMSSAEIASFSSMNADYAHTYFAHEIAHQWWGHAVSEASLEDEWLSESFAEYTSGLYVMGLLGTDRFQGQLKEWRDQARIADPHGSIAWANNIRGMNSGDYRTYLLYGKGPYVIHMLRMQVGHDNFVKALKNLVANQRFKSTTTDDVKREFEAVVGYKLDFFFDQWFRGTGIPTFDYATEVRQADDGKWVATVKINQRDKANPKVVNMPVFFHFGKDKVVVKERPILKAEDVYQIKLPEKPQKITLDDYKTLLADIVSQDPAGH